MTEQEYLNKLHADLLKIIDEVASICTQLNIKYYLMGGTLLGAVRHKGFIPWDDDLDIGMSRNEMNRFFENAPALLPQWLKIGWYPLDRNYHKLHAKVCMKNTEFVEYAEGYTPIDQGLFIDIFPLDEVPHYSKRLEKRKRIVSLCNELLFRKTNSKGVSVLKILYRLIPYSLLHKIALRSMTKTNGNHCDNMTSFASHYSVKKQTMPREVYGEGCNIEFEGRQYLAPSDYIYVLKHLFGDNYMELPPVEKRETHMPIRVKFSDGTIYENEPKK